MTFDEWSVGPLYLCGLRVNRILVPPHFIDIVEMNAPWRRGRAIVLPIFWRRGLALGLWTRDINDDIEDDFDDSTAPAWAKFIEVSPEEIRAWDNGAEPEAEEEGTTAGESEQRGPAQTGEEALDS